MQKRFALALILTCSVTAAVVATLIYPATAWAQTAAAAPAADAVSIKPMLDAFVALLTTLLTGVGSWAVTLFCSWLKLQKDSLVRKALIDGVNTAIAFAIQRLQAAESQLATVKIQNAIVAEATQFLVVHFPDAIKYFGLNTDAIARMILARLPTPVDPAIAALPAPAGVAQAAA